MDAGSDDGGECFDCHDPRFVLDERALPLGAALLVFSALRLLHEYAQMPSADASTTR